MVLTERQRGMKMSSNNCGLNDNGGNFWLGVLAEVLGNAISKALDSDGPVKGGVLDSVVNGINQIIPK
jgi:hypothetical protein